MSELRLRGGEKRASTWLNRVADKVCYVGNGEGPPDFVIQWGGTEVAVEVMTMLDGEGWEPTRRIAFERALRDVVEGVRNETGTPRWHVSCEYDPRVPRPPKPRGSWEETVRDALRRPGLGGEVQLCPQSLRVGQGIVVKYVPASNDGSFSGVMEDTGLLVAETALTQIESCVARKARRVRKGHRARRFTSWWLVLVDEVVIIHEVLGEEWADVKAGVRTCEGIEQWNKVILLSGFSEEATAVYERPGEARLA